MTIDLEKDMLPISEFRSRAADIIGQVRREGGPLLITQRGRSVAVLLSLEEFQRLVRRREVADALARGRRDVARSAVVSHEAVDRRFEKWRKRRRSSSAGRKRR